MKHRRWRPDSIRSNVTRAYPVSFMNTCAPAWRLAPRRRFGLMPLTLRALCLAAGICCTSSIHAQAKPEPAVPLPRTENVVKPSADPPGTTRFEEAVQHGFFGDLSRPAPPALNRIQGIRIPEAEKNPRQAEPPPMPSVKPAAEPQTHVTTPVAAPADRSEPAKGDDKDRGGVRPGAELSPATSPPSDQK